MIIVIDDERTFLSGFASDEELKYRKVVANDSEILYARTSDEGLALIAKRLVNWFKGDEGIDQLWLDHDLGGDDDIRPVVDFLIMLYHITDADDGRGPEVQGFIKEIFVHSQNPTTDWIVQSLKHADICSYGDGYSVKRVPLPELV